MIDNLFSQKFAKDRTEDDILAHSPIKLMLGQKEFPVPPLALRKGAEWRAKLLKTLEDLAGGAMSSGMSPEGFMKGLMVAFFTFPEQVLELLVAYSPEVLESEREFLMDKATDEEITVAFSRLLVVAYPYFSLLATMKTAAMATPRATSRQ